MQLMVLLNQMQCLKFSYFHIFYLFQDYLGGTSKDVSREEFVEFIKKAVDRKTPEFRQLYFFLLKCFQAGDVHKVRDE